MFLVLNRGKLDLRSMNRRVEFVMSGMLEEFRCIWVLEGYIGYCFFWFGIRFLCCGNFYCGWRFYLVLSWRGVGGNCIR